MNFILLSGGSGKRLWPLSNDVRSKQFLKILKSDVGEYESMVQRVYRQIQDAVPDACVTIATGKKQVSSIVNQLGEKVSICVEPARRDTFPAIALAASYLACEKKVKPDEAVAVCPVDPYVDTEYFAAIGRLTTEAQKGTGNLYLLGVKPTYPSEKYGYIVPAASGNVMHVDSFKEKPTKEKAEEYLSQGALWNCGVFAFRLGYLLNIVQQRFGTTDYWTLYRRYETLEKISFDYAVVEKESSVYCMQYEGMWKDIGTWNTLAEEMAEPSIGNVVLSDSCENTTAINELSIPVLCMGLKNVIVAASGDGIIVSDKEQSSYIKPYVDKIEGQVMLAEKSWGSFTVLDVQPTSMTIRILMREGHQLTYHTHEHRDEVWTVIRGSGYTIVDGIKQSVRPGDVITMSAGCKHTIHAETEMQVIEVQLGSEIDAEDKTVFKLEEDM